MLKSARDLHCLFTEVHSIKQVHVLVQEVFFTFLVVSHSAYASQQLHHFKALASSPEPASCTNTIIRLQTEVHFFKVRTR